MPYQIYLRPTYPNELYHHGIKGQKWGVRRFQNPDGSLTAAGQKRYNKGVKILEKKYKREYMRDTRKERLSELKNSKRDKDGTYSDKELDKILNRQYKDAEKYVKDKMSKVTIEDAMKAYSTHQKKVAATVAAASAITLTAAASAKYMHNTKDFRKATKDEEEARKLFAASINDLQSAFREHEAASKPHNEYVKRTNDILNSPYRQKAWEAADKHNKAWENARTAKWMYEDALSKTDREARYGGKGLKTAERRIKKVTKRRKKENLRSPLPIYGKYGR